MGQIYEDENGAISAEFFESEQDLIQQKMREFESVQSKLKKELIAEANGISQEDVIDQLRVKLQQHLEKKGDTT